jgi:2-oxoisovalerate dehydrogenase E2 component (dihydrolipoyl transacylase)
LRLTPLPFFARALVRAVIDFPQMNALYDDQAGVIRRHAAIHLGIAVQTEAGLMAPVVRHAEALDLADLAREIGRLAQAARAGKAKREELSGSTITLTSLGALGGVATTPVINRPEVAIVSPNRIVARPVVVAGRIEVRQVMNLSSSFDHLVIDGYEAAAFIQRAKALLEVPALLFVDR